MRTTTEKNIFPSVDKGTHIYYRAPFNLTWWWIAILAKPLESKN